MAELAGLHARITGDSSGLVAALGAGQKAVSETQRRINGLVGVSDRLQNSAAKSAQAFREFDQAKRAVDRLRSSYDPLFAASRQYEIAVDEITEALRLGVVTQGQYEVMLDNLGQSYLTAAGQMNVLGTAMRASSQHTTNLMFQFQDIGMMLAAGQSPLMLAMQQGTQVAGVFQQMKNEGQSAFRGIIGGLAAVISPMSLVTIGTIAGVAALGQWAISAIGASYEARTLADTLDALDAITSTAHGANEILAMSVQDLTEKYGEYAEAVRDAARSQLMLAEAEAAQRLQTALADVSDALDGLTQRSGSFLRSGTMMTTAIGNIAEQFGVTRQEAALLEQAFRDLETAPDWESQVSALRQIERLLDESGAEASDLPPPLVAALQELNALVISSADLAANMNSAKVEAMAFNEAFNAGGFGPDSRARSAPPRAPSLLGEPEIKKGQSRKERSIADQVENDLEALRTGLMTQEELQMQSFATQQEVLQQALEQRLLTQQEYNALFEETQAAHVDAMNQIDRARQMAALDGFAGMFGDLASLMTTQNAKLFKIGQAAAIAEATVSGYKAAVEAWEKGMEIGGPPVAAAFTAASLARTGALIGQIASQRIGGGGAASSGGGGAAGGAGATAQPQQGPLQVSLTGITPDSLFTGDQIGGLLDRLTQEAGDRGVQFVGAR